MTSISSHIVSSFKLGTLDLPNRLMQAPMAGISNRAFRLQARRHGVGLTFSEMVSSYGVHYRNRRTHAMLELTDDEHPVAIQIFGSDPEIMAEAAVAVEQAGADLVDINMGCPVRKVVKTGAGVALMEDPELAARIVSSVVAAVRIPVTAKFRSGPRKENTALEFALRLADAGASSLCIHPRFGVQGLKGRADHAVTATLVTRLAVPVIASGDIDSADAAATVMRDTGCMAVMVGQAALGNPWLYGDILAGSGAGRRPLSETLAELERFYHDLEEEVGEERAVRWIRKFYGWYLAPFKPDSELRQGMRTATGFTDAFDMLQDWSGRDRG
jgi:nifR3 family TIM-barrel protein